MIQDELPVYIAGERIVPHLLLTARDDNNKKVEVSRNKTLLWIIARHVFAETQKMSSWKGLSITTIYQHLSIYCWIYAYYKCTSYRYVHSLKKIEAAY